MVGATEIIVGNAPMELTASRAACSRSAMQVGGSVGTAVLGAIVAGKVADVLPGYSATPSCAPLSADQQELVNQGASFAQAGAAPGTPEPIMRAIEGVVHLSFLDGMHVGFTVSTAVAVLAALLALFVKAGRKTDGAPGSPGLTALPIRPPPSSKARAFEEGGGPHATQMSTDAETTGAGA